MVGLAPFIPKYVAGTFRILSDQCLTHGFKVLPHSMSVLIPTSVDESSPEANPGFENIEGTTLITEKYKNHH